MLLSSRHLQILAEAAEGNEHFVMRLTTAGSGIDRLFSNFRGAGTLRISIQATWLRNSSPENDTMTEISAMSLGRSGTSSLEDQVSFWAGTTFFVQCIPSRISYLYSQHRARNSFSAFVSHFCPHYLGRCPVSEQDNTGCGNAHTQIASASAD